MEIHLRAIGVQIIVKGGRIVRLMALLYKRLMSRMKSSRVIGGGKTGLWRRKSSPDWENIPKIISSNSPVRNMRAMVLSRSGSMTWRRLRSILPGGKHLPSGLCWRKRTSFCIEARQLDILFKRTSLCTYGIQADQLGTGSERDRFLLSGHP
jgi:hypothetical protein